MKDKLISAEALLLSIRDDLEINGKNFIRIKEHINNAPDAVRHGRWVHPKGCVVSNGFLCTECGHHEASLYPIHPRPGGVYIADENGNFYYPPPINYCPNCGARMDGENDG